MSAFDFENKQQIKLLDFSQNRGAWQSIYIITHILKNSLFDSRSACRTSGIWTLYLALILFATIVEIRNVFLS